MAEGFVSPNQLSERAAACLTDLPPSLPLDAASSDSLQDGKTQSIPYRGYHRFYPETSCRNGGDSGVMGNDLSMLIATQAGERFSP